MEIVITIIKEDRTRNRGINQNGPPSPFRSYAPDNQSPIGGYWLRMGNRARLAPIDLPSAGRWINGNSPEGQFLDFNGNVVAPLSFDFI